MLQHFSGYTHNKHLMSAATAAASDPLLGSKDGQTAASSSSAAAEKKLFLNEISKDWKFHRDDVLKEVFEMCDKDGDHKIAGIYN